MVKNKTGGNRAKSFARKNEHSMNTEHDRLRLPEEDGELFAIVTKIFGGTICSITTSNGLTLLGHIRKKFTRRSKRNHIVSVNSIVMIGLRSWESVPKNCDILEIYSASDISQLKLIPGFPFTEALETSATEKNDLFSFSETCDDVGDDMNSTIISASDSFILPSSSDEINIDDI